MRRRLFNAVTLLSLMLCGAVVAAYFWSWAGGAGPVTLEYRGMPWRVMLTRGELRIDDLPRRAPEPEDALRRGEACDEELQRLMERGGDIAEVRAAVDRVIAASRAYAAVLNKPLVEYHVPLAVPAAVCGAIVTACSARTVGRLARRRRARQGLCRRCGYDLTANVSGVCPECGSDVRAKGTLP